MAKTLAELAALVPDSYIIGDGSLEIASIQHDSRKVTQGTLFACMVGAHVDGHTFIAQAREKGLVRLEGKEYVVQDGDIVLFRFNV